MSDFRDRLAAVLYGNLRRQQRIDRPDRFLDWIDTSELADAVIRELTEAIPPIVATAIQGYAQSGLAALSHHGDASAIEELKRMNKEALHIAQYATTHEDWNGEWKRYE